MTKEEFERKIRGMILQPSPETSSALYEMGLDALGEEGPQNILAAFDFIARNFDRDVLQSAYEIIRHGSAALPGEMVAAAVFLQNGDTPDRMSRMADDGYLMCFHTPRAMGESSPLAVCTVIEGGKTTNLFSMRFGEFTPERVFHSAKEYAGKQSLPVLQALQCATVDGKIETASHEGRRLMSSRWPEMTEAMFNIFERCPAVAAHIIFNVDQDRISVKINSLLEKSQQIKARKSREKSKKNLTR